MSFYSHVVFPRICDVLLNRPMVAQRRRDLLSHVTGEVLELGFGTGLNLPCYPADVKKLTAVEPNVGMHPLAVRRIRKSRLDVIACNGRAERLPFANASFDSVVCTFTLCSIPDAGQAVQEAFRVLKKGGRFFFLEHGQSPDPHVQAWQRRLNWLEMCLADGCRLDRDVDHLLASQPFSDVRIEHSYLSGVPKTHGYLFQGIATK